MTAPRHRIFLKAGITPDLTEDVLRNFFQKFGEVIDVYLPRDPATSELKGFAFVAFSDSEGVNEALRESSHVIEGRTIPVTRADPRSSGTSHFRERGASYASRLPSAYHGPHSIPAAIPQVPPASPYGYDGISMSAVNPGSYLPIGVAGTAATGGMPPVAPLMPPGVPEPLSLPYPETARSIPSGGYLGRGGAGEGDDFRIYVGGVPDEVTREDVKEHFEKYGPVVDVYFPKDKASGRRRTFCYVRFSTYEAADMAVARSQRTIKGHDIVEIRVAQPRPTERSYRYAPY